MAQDTSLPKNQQTFPESVSITTLAETLSALANAAGGEVLIGVSPGGNEITGLRDPQAAADRVFQAVLRIQPPLVLPMPQPVQQAGRTLLRVRVPAGLPHVYSLDGRYLTRQNGHNVPLTDVSLRRLLVERGQVQFESLLPPDVTLDALDPDQVEAYRQVLALPADTTPETLLVQRGCARRTPQGDLRPTYAGLLLFGHNPQRWLPSATILAARFPGVAFGEAFIKQEISSSLPRQLRLAEAFLRDNLPRTVRVEGLAHQETWAYPFEAVRELLVNAVAHRDYNQQGDCVHLNLFADHLEVHSPGGLPGPVTLNNLLQARYSRNPVIVQVLSDLGFVERLGYGLDRVVTAVKQAGLPPPRFEEVAGSFRVHLFAASPRQPLPDVSVYQGLGLNPRQEKLVAYLVQNRRVTNREYQQLCPDVHPETLRRDLADLTGRGLLMKMGNKRGTYYVLKPWSES
ncbi:MAG: transcriptional regulator [Anaerolineae bacterium]|nr:MAG: transcriptional regulator [Anaerolineae bacterium]